MNKNMVNWFVIAGVCGWVCLPDLIPILGDMIDAGVVAWALAYFKSQAAERFPHDERFSDERIVRRPQYGANTEIVDVEYRRVP